MSEPGPAWYVRPGSALEDWAEGLAWLWRLGPPASDPGVAALRFCDEEGVLAGELQPDGPAAIVFVSGAAPARGPLPGRRVAGGVARLPAGSVAGEFTVFDRGEGAVRSNLGVHAFRDGRRLVVGCDPAAQWGDLASYWVYPLIREFVEEITGSRIDALPAIGVLRFDDIPGTAQHQLEGRDKPDARQAPRIRRLVGAFRAAGAVINVAVPAQGLDARGEPAGLDAVWERSVAELRAGCEDGVVEPVCHGCLHADLDRSTEGEVEFREFAHLDLEDARARISAAIAWQTRALRAPSTFVAPAWAYGPGGRAAASELGLPAWLPPDSPKLLEGDGVHESLIDGPRGIHGFDYHPIVALADAGIPPTIVTHGMTLDIRAGTLRRPREALTLARLLIRRDVLRLAELEGISWIGAGEFVERLRTLDAAQ
jgi:hypothetical protein